MKTLFIDLDGVLNEYDGNYEENYIPPLKDGALDLLKKLSQDYKIKIFTTRDKNLAYKWICSNNLEEYVFEVTNVKEPAYAYIDDRNINFNGNYNKLYNDIKNFNVWYRNGH